MVLNTNKLAHSDSLAEAATKEVTSLENIKHPLENTWSFWLFTNKFKENKRWAENLVEMSTFHTVEDYWCHYHHMKLPSELSQGQEYMVFKHGIRPMWEDAVNKNGGRWIITFEGKNNSELDRIWLDVVLLMIGESFENSNSISGAVVSVRSRRKISVWTQNADQNTNFEIGRKLKKTLQLRFKLIFCLHNSSNVTYSV